MNRSTKTPAPARLEAYEKRLAGLYDLRGQYLRGLARHRSRSAWQRWLRGGRSFERSAIEAVRYLNAQIHQLTLGHL